MDRFVADFPARPDGDLMLCEMHGLAYQADMTAAPVPYDEKYFSHYVALEDQEIGRRINEARIALVARYKPRGWVLDVGIGSGEFIKKRGTDTAGFDVNPVARAWLKERGLWAEHFRAFYAFTFWDVLEHIEDPEIYFKDIEPGSYLFTSLPIFSDLSRVRESKHYKPGEHLYYWTESGFVAWMAQHRFRLLERSDVETKAGREAILSFAFRRDIEPPVPPKVLLHQC